MAKLERRENCGCGVPPAKLERRDNCGCSVPPAKLERRENRGANGERLRASVPYTHRRGFWDFDEWEFGWLMGAGIVITVVAVVEAAKAAKAAVEGGKSGAAAP